ncbi:Protein CBG11061 [Caenorhabditis briggsae]|uniref:Uncharacterized protein n=2 Tax=Caenorhabditis briggsae TaxID=6238 RepID=A0AAE9E6W0_CAEBR|nr:Protein CBG11061 [Caenorhabditis briggsae]ULU04753.1 hypothetical protein L3Y34_017481 [Caenorhabditis briggsae]UMM16740.1 hypothetical protein L5515_013621 [Caenorhabditis briggsae]CAP30280.2 Protein CBG11061 [Caenorhabditis briggsae]
MSKFQLKVAKYYRLSEKSASETENVSIFVDTSTRRLSVFTRQIERERVTMTTDSKQSPSMMFRDNYLYILYSNGSNEGFRVTFRKEERDEFLKIAHSIGIFQEIPIDRPPEGSSQFSQESTRGSGGIESQGPSHRPPSFTQQPTPSPHMVPNIRRDTTHVLRRSSNFAPFQSHGTSFSQPIHFSYNPDPHSRNSFQRNEHEFGESVARKSGRIGKKDEKRKVDKAIQTDDLIDSLMEDEEFTAKAIETFMNNEQFVEVVKKMRTRLENMDTVERQRLHWKTNPDYNNQGMPPPVIRLPTSEME